MSLWSPTSAWEMRRGRQALWPTSSTPPLSNLFPVANSDGGFYDIAAPAIPIIDAPYASGLGALSGGGGWIDGKYYNVGPAPVGSPFSGDNHVASFDPGPETWNYEASYDIVIDGGSGQPDARYWHNPALVHAGSNYGFLTYAGHMAGGIFPHDHFLGDNFVFGYSDDGGITWNRYDAVSIFETWIAANHPSWNANPLQICGGGFVPVADDSLWAYCEAVIETGGDPFYVPLSFSIFVHPGAASDDSFSEGWALGATPPDVADHPVIYAESYYPLCQGVSVFGVGGAVFNGGGLSVCYGEASATNTGLAVDDFAYSYIPTIGRSIVWSWNGSTRTTYIDDGSGWGGATSEVAPIPAFETVTSGGPVPWAPEHGLLLAADQGTFAVSKSTEGLSWDEVLPSGGGRPGVGQ